MEKAKCLSDSSLTSKCQLGFFLRFSFRSLKGRCRERSREQIRRAIKPTKNRWDMLYLHPNVVVDHDITSFGHRRCANYQRLLKALWQRGFSGSWFDLSIHSLSSLPSRHISITYKGFCYIVLNKKWLMNLIESNFLLTYRKMQKIKSFYLNCFMYNFSSTSAVV